MKIGLRIFLGYFLIVGLAGWFVMRVFVDEVKPGVRQAMEDTLADTAYALAEQAAPDLRDGRIATGRFAAAVDRLSYRELNARKMFWISLIVSGVVIGAFALIGVDDKKLYLFSMDLLYDVEHGIFTSGGGGVIEAGIVAVTLAFSLTALRFAWTRRDALLAGDRI